ncbi:hypothetical protein FHG87_020100 [Trinorchestia longiramus]|nr:hypothetical protein FHG87_020100 [Trinorchestia longiramus]
MVPSQSPLEMLQLISDEQHLCSTHQSCLPATYRLLLRALNVPQHTPRLLSSYNPRLKGMTAGQTKQQDRQESRSGRRAGQAGKQVREIPEKYPKLWEAVKLDFLSFSSSYMAGRGFGAVTQLLSKQRNRIQIVQRGDLRLILSSIEPRIHELVKKHQAHPSH